MTDTENDAVPAKPKAPPRLATAGKALWRRIVAEYDLDVRELVLLESSCRQSDDVARLETLLGREGLIVQGSQGQPRLSAVITELRQARLAFARLLAEIALPTDEEEKGLSPASRRAQKAAHSRHDRNRAQAERAAELGSIADRRRRLTANGG